MSEHGHLVAFGRCWGCGRTFTFDPDLVPAIPIDPMTSLPLDLDEHGNEQAIDPDAAARAEKQPVCESCVALANELRRRAGRPEIPILPGAYLRGDA